MAASSNASAGRSHVVNNGWAAYNIGIMVVDEDPTSLLFISTMLRCCHYRVVSFDDPIEALYEVCKRFGEIDLVIIDLHSLSIPGFELIERIAKGVGLPTISTTADEDSQLLHRSLDCGACFHLVKPITINNMEFVWKKSWSSRVKGPLGTPRPLKLMNNNKVPSYQGDGISAAGKRLHHVGSSSPKKLARDESSYARKRDDLREKDGDSDSEELGRVRLQWDRELHDRFRVAVALLGDDAVPTSIIGIMNVTGLTTKQVASHLQKYRKRVKKEKELKAKEEKRANSHKTNDPITPTAHAPDSSSSKKPIVNNQNHKHQITGGTRKVPFILPKPPAPAPAPAPPQLLKIRNCTMANTYPMSIENIAMLTSRKEERAGFLKNWKNQVELNANRRLQSYQQNPSPVLIAPEPSVTDQFALSTTDAGVSEAYNNLFPSKPDPAASYILDTSAGATAWQHNAALGASDTATQDPVVDADSEWRALEDHLLGLNDQVADAGVVLGSSTKFDFDFNFDFDYNYGFNGFNDLPLDDAFLAEMLDDISNGGLPN